MDPLTQTELKQQAQEDLLHFAGNAFYQLSDDMDRSIESTDEYDRYREHLIKQYKRIQTLFGYEPSGYQG